MTKTKSEGALAQIKEKTFEYLNELNTIDFSKRSLSMRVVLTYYKRVLDSLKYIFEHHPERISQELKHLLEHEWIICNGTILSYTVGPNYRYKKLMIDLAEYVANTLDLQCPNVGVFNL